GLKAEYFIFSDPLIIIAGAILLDSLRDLRFHKWAFPIAATLFGLHIAFSQAEPVKSALKRTGPESVCEWNGYYMPLMPLPWCAGRRNGLLSKGPSVAVLFSIAPSREAP